jgi:hypothetical protein
MLQVGTIGIEEEEEEEDTGDYKRTTHTLLGTSPFTVINVFYL